MIRASTVATKKIVEQNIAAFWHHLDGQYLVLLG